MEGMSTGCLSPLLQRVKPHRRPGSLSMSVQHAGQMAQVPSTTPGQWPRGAEPPQNRRPMFFTFPEAARWNAERQAVEFGVEIGDRYLCEDIGSGFELV